LEAAIGTRNIQHRKKIANMSVNPRKRKVVTRPAPVESESEEELADGLLEGILSHSEDDSDANEEEDDTDASSVIEGLSDEDEDDNEEAGDEADEIRKQMRNLNTSDGSLQRKTRLPTHMALEDTTNGELEEEDESLKPNYTMSTSPTTLMLRR
jgi:ribosome biogenesis protein ERB1